MNYYIILLNEHNDKVIKMISHPLDLKKIQKMKVRKKLLIVVLFQFSKKKEKKLNRRS